MASQVRIYRLKEFIRLNKSGVIDVEGSKALIRQLAAASGVHAVDNILVDLRDTTIKDSNMGDVFEVVAEIARYEPAFRGKIANVIPGDQSRIAVAKQIRDLAGMPGRYEIFTNFEDAIDWLSEIKSCGHAT